MTRLSHLSAIFLVAGRRVTKQASKPLCRVLASHLNSHQRRHFFRRNMGNDMTVKLPNEEPKPEIVKTPEEWKAALTPLQYHVAREKGTERAFSGELYLHKGNGTYNCICCGNPLFESKTKYESGSGWPSFWQPIDGAVRHETDESHGMVRTEATCKKCEAHLGHVFNDGPKQTGLRYCINSASLNFKGE